MRFARTQLALGCMLAASVALSTVHPFGNPRLRAQPDGPLLQGSQPPANVLASLQAKCADCHSQQTHYPLYAHIAPISWMMDRDINEGRSKFDMSAWPSMNAESRISVLTRLASVIHAGEMPPRKYVMLHPGARLSPEEQHDIYEWAKTERRRIREQTGNPPDQSSVVPGLGARGPEKP